MTKLVAVVRSDDYPFDRRQLPLNVDENLTMVIQFNDSCAGCSQESLKQKELEAFVNRFHVLSNDEVAVALMVTSKEITEMLSQMVPCVGCRKSVERLFGQLISSCHPALEPLVITQNSVLSIRREFLFDPKAVFALFYVHRSRFSVLVDNIPKSKKNKRCVLHSLDAHKTKSVSWEDVWDILSDECREEVVLIKCTALTETMDNYLRKHRFCADCKAKVQRAYALLVKEVDHKTEKGYQAAHYNGIRCCKGEGHLHLLCETDYISKLIERAEPEMLGGRERHAKTIEIAQEEVLTCLGIHVYERLNKIWQKLRAEEQTWQILFYLGVDALKKNFEVALEKKQGISNLELICKELLQEEKAKEEKRKQKQQKKKKKKSKKVECDENTNIQELTCHSCDDAHSVPAASSIKQQVEEHCKKCGLSIEQNNDVQSESSASVCKCGTGDNVERRNAKEVQQNEKERCLCSNPSDCGYSSGHEGCDSCSVPSSLEGSDIACNECHHDGDNQQSEVGDMYSCKNCSKPASVSFCSPKRHTKLPDILKVAGEAKPRKCKSATNAGISLVDMWDSIGGGFQEEEDADEDGLIPQEEIQQFMANQSILINQRDQYRERLRMKFDNMKLNKASC